MLDWPFNISVGGEYKGFRTGFDAKIGRWAEYGLPKHEWGWPFLLLVLVASIRRLLDFGSRRC